MGGLTSASAAARASETVGLKPWRLAGATSPKVATGSYASAPTSKDAGLGVEVAYVFERYAGPQPTTGSAAVNAKIIPPMHEHPAEGRCAGGETFNGISETGHNPAGCTSAQTNPLQVHMTAVRRAL